MSSFNQVILMGNITRDPELRFTPKGTAVCKFGLAVNRQWKDTNGESKQETTFVDVDSFGKTAENIGKYFKKGNPIFIVGRLKLDQWEDRQTNQKRQKLGVVAETFQFVESRGGQSAAPPPARGSTAPSESGPPAAGAPDEDQEVPF